MNDSKNAIHRAAQNCPTPTLPAGFQTRIAERIKAERRREERQEKLSYIAMGVTVVALLAFVLIFAAQRLDFSWASSRFAPQRWQRAKLWGMFAALLCAMLSLDSYIRQRIYLHRLKKELSKQQAK